MVTKSKAFIAGFVVFLVVLVLGLLAVALHNISENQRYNIAVGTDLQPHPQSSPALSAVAAFASVTVFFLGLKLFFKKRPGG